MTTDHLLSCTQIRACFAAALSQMYQQEVPKYGTLLNMVRTINQQYLQQYPAIRQQLSESGDLQRVDVERHGAIRLGTAIELQTMRRLFAVMGMYPVAYYDLSEAGIPVHSTAFRPLDIEQLNQNPFRIFTSLLRLDLIADDDLRMQAQQILDKRNIFTPRVIELIELFEQQQGLNRQQAEQFVEQALHSFRWHQQATVDLAGYRHFLNAHRLIADIVCFKGPHINHLTPRTLDIDEVQLQMEHYGLDAKAIIEGPPLRKHPILLRQTSFKALEEQIEFFRKDNQPQQGSHTARFGEIEQRGMALTPKGRALYDRLLNKVRQQVKNAVSDPQFYYRTLQHCFRKFPDDLMQLQQQGLAFFRYQANTKAMNQQQDNLQQLITQGALTIHPITYEDFLPVSAAGIFQSNLQEGEASDFNRSPNQHKFEQALGCPVHSEFELYAGTQQSSLEQALQQLGFNADSRDQLIHQLVTE